MRQPFFVVLAAAATLLAFGPAESASPDVAGRQALLMGYAASAVASERCGGRALTMLEESRLGRVIRSESGEVTSMTQVAEALAANRRMHRPDCGSREVRENIKLFADVVLPQLQSATPRQ